MSISLPSWLSAANLQFARDYPGEQGARRPVHVVYGGAHLFNAGLCRKLGDLAIRTFCEYAPDAEALADVTGMGKEIASAVYPRVIEKLQKEPVEDYRIDFEDGYGVRPNEEEDGHTEAAARETARGFAEGTLAAFFGIRIKPLDEELKARSFRTLDRFLTTLLQESGGALPPNFVVTLPKITVVEQVKALAEALDASAPACGIELMMETPQALRALPEMVAATGGKCTAVHFGPYDYTASLGIAASQQTLVHPACDFARSWMQAALAGTGIALADGPTTILPIPPHRREPPHGAKHAENRVVVHRAWRLHYDHVRRALDRGFYQGWDLHPAQLPIRYAAVFAFFLEGLAAASERLRNFTAKAAQATRIVDVFDDAATGQVLINYFLRAVRCGALPESEIPGLTGLSETELRLASFPKILQGRLAAGHEAKA